MSSATSSTTRSTTRRADATPSTSPSPSALRAKVRPAGLRDRRRARAIPPRSCAPTTASTATLPAKTNGCSPTCLKKDWQFPGFVLSDWGGTHSTEKASAAGLDNEEPGRFFYDSQVTRPPSKPEPSRKPNSTSTCIASCAPCLPPASSIIPASAASSIPSPALKWRARSKKAASFC